MKKEVINYLKSLKAVYYQSMQHLVLNKKYLMPDKKIITSSAKQIVSRCN